MSFQTPANLINNETRKPEPAYKTEEEYADAFKLKAGLAQNLKVIILLNLKNIFTKNLE